jgi:HAD superfamily hydrolase (TIGR01450 family)
VNQTAPTAGTYRLSPIDRLEPPVRGLIIDMDGVLWKDATPIGDLSKVFSVIAARGLLLAAATNNATQSPDEYAHRLRGFGVTLDPRQIVTSAEATARTLEARFPDRGRVFVVGEHGVVSRVQTAGFHVITDPADNRTVAAVVAGLDRDLTYEKLSAASRHVRSGAFFCGTNPDPTFPTPQGLIPGAGSIIAAISAAAEVAPTFIGKPATLLFDIAAQQMGLGKPEILVVGDRLATDIAGGQAWGARTALVLSGVSSAAAAGAWLPPPDIIASDLAELVGT